MDLFLGFGKVLRVRFLRAAPERRSLIGGAHVETLSERKWRHDKVVALLERRRLLIAEGVDVADIEKQVKALGFVFEDEPSRPGLYSYWAKR
jgi:hypothetical protein